MVTITESGYVTSMAESDKMEIESNGTVEEDKEHAPTPTYSSVLQASNIRKRRPKVYDNTWKITTQKRIGAKLKENRKHELNSDSWTIDRIIGAFKNKSELAVLIIDKCHAIPAVNKLPESIDKQFENKDTTFFISFNRQKKIQPQ